VTRIVLDIDDTMWKVDHLARVMRSAESEFLSELAAQVDIQVTDARPLIVLDFDSDVCADVVGDLQYAVTFLAAHGLGTAFIADIADQIEAQTKPARIPEPGLWGVVEAVVQGDDEPQHFTRGPKGGSVYHWTRISDGLNYHWDDLIDPTPIREGVS
jgi:hypothetical protein